MIVSRKKHSSFSLYGIQNAYERSATDSRRVAEAYGGDLAEAMADTDEEVAAMVRDWEKSQGLEVRDWGAIGRDERVEF